MPQNWKTYRFEELYAEPSRNGLTKPKRVRGEGFKMVNMGELFAHAFLGTQDMDRVPMNDKELKSSMLEEGDLLFARQSLVEAGVGKCSLVKDLVEPTTFESHIIRVRPNQELAAPAFLYYLFQAPLARHQIMALANGVAAFGIKGSDLSALDLTIPPLPEQKAIASILSAIDDKIENNLAMNKTLEEMAMALYKHWFVDFGPFQHQEFSDSELGSIPKGWEVKRTEDVFAVKDGTHDSPKRQEAGKYLITSKHLKDNQIDFTSAYRISEEDFEKVNQRSKVDKGDILMTMIGTVGVFYLVQNNPDYAIKNIGLFKTSETPELQRYLYLFFSSENGKQYIQSQLAGSTQQYLTLKVLRSFPFVVPPEIVLNEFNDLVTPWFGIGEANHAENRTLTQLRDTLLPKLISGEVRVKDAEQTVANAL